MNINANNKLTSNKGFTIVELLIVIVVIGILAAIVVVAYNGVQEQARTTAAQSNAKEIVNKAEVYAVQNDGVYPTESQLTTDASGETWELSEAATGVIADGDTASVTGGGAWPSGDADDNVYLESCDGDGVIVYYQDYSDSEVAEPLRGGNCA